MQDFKSAFRQALRNPGFTLIAILTLALGIGANTAIFSVVKGVILNPLPYPAADRLLWMGERTIRSGETPISFPDFKDWQQQQTVFDEIGVYNWGTYNLTGAGDPARLSAGQMTATTFKVLGTQPIHGRSFSTEEDKPGGPRVVILSFGLWQERFDGEPKVIGRPLVLNGASYQVVGVMPAGFAFPTPVDIWVPLGSFAGEAWFQDRDSHPGLEGIARLKAGVTIEQARAEMEVIASRLAQQFPETNREVRALITPLHERIVGRVRQGLWTLLGAVGLVLFIACANVGNLLLAKAVGRQREMAVRAAMGATEGRLVRQLLVEGLLLAGLSGAAGLLLARWGMSLMLSLGYHAVPRASEIHMDGGVLLFTGAATLVTGILFGLAPSLQAGRWSIQAGLREGTRGATCRHRSTQRTLVMAEVSLTIMLLIGTGLVLRSLVKLQTEKTGFSWHHVLAFRVDLPALKYPTFDQQNLLYQTLIENLRALPGVEAAAVTSRAPLEQFNWLSNYLIDGEPAPVSDRTMDVTVASPDYFRAMGIHMIRGRAFTDRDNRDHLRNGPQVSERAAGLNAIIVDEEFVRRHWPNEDPIGKRLQLPWGSQHGNTIVTVVGVVPRVKVRALNERGGFPQAYLPAWQLPETGRAVVVRTKGPPEAIFKATRDQVHALDSELPVSSLHTVAESREDLLAPQRLSLVLLGAFGTMAVALAAIGLYAVLAYAVNQRHREIGVRMALGAQRHHILLAFINDGMRVVAVGIVLGLAGAAILTRLIGTLLFDVKPFDPLTFTTVPILLGAVALIASWLPARRATHVDPMEALKNEG